MLPVAVSKKSLVLIGLALVATVFLGRLMLQRPLASSDNTHVADSFTVQGDIRGQGQDSLLRPLAAVMDNQGQIYVADSSHHRVLVFDVNGKVIFRIGKPGKGQGYLDYPTAVAVKDNRLFVADSTNLRIQVFTKQGEFLYAFPRLEDKLDKVKPVALTLDSKDNVYVADGAGQRIMVLNVKGKFLRSFGRRGTGEGELNFPNGIALDEQGRNLYVADFANGRIQVFSPEGKFKRVIKGEAGFTNPRGLAFDPVKKRLYVADIFEHRVAVLNEKGELLGNFGTVGSGPLQFHFPNGLWYGKGILLVADRENHRIVVIHTGGENTK